MDNSSLEVADIFREHGEVFRRHYSVSREQSKVMRDIKNCRTIALGGHLDQCDQCGFQRPSYNSCRNRHCPKCQSAAKERWIEARKQTLLPVVYFHVVFTLPQPIACLALQNKAVVYDLLFKTAAETLKTLADDPKHLGARIGFFAVLHTWGQQLLHHPHVHCVVPGGGISPDGNRWIPCRRSSKGKHFFISVLVLSKLFRRLFKKALFNAFQAGELEFFGKLSALRHPENFKKWLAAACEQDWVVYAKRPFGSPAAVVEYLGRYTHRVAISNSRLVSMQNNKVSFRWRDYRHGNNENILTLSATEFIRRFLLHTLPSGFTRIRYYGILSNRYVKDNLERSRMLLHVPEALLLLPKPPVNPKQLVDKLSEDAHDVCPKCKWGRMVPVAEISPCWFVFQMRPSAPPDDG